MPRQLGHPDQMYTRQCCKNHVPNKVLRFLKKKPHHTKDCSHISGESFPAQIAYDFHDCLFSLLTVGAHQQ